MLCLMKSFTNYLAQKAGVNLEVSHEGYADRQETSGIHDV